MKMNAIAVCVGVSVAIALVTSCRFSGEQLLLPEAPMPEDSGVAITEGRASTTSAANSSTSSKAAPSSAISPGSADAGASAVMQHSAPMTMTMTMTSAMTSPSAGAPAAERSSDAGMSGAAGASGPPQTSARASDPMCDLSGLWIVKQVTVDLALDVPEFTNNWAYFEIEQSGVDFVVRKHMDCGGEILGGGTVSLSRATLEGYVQHNMQTGRKGRFAPNDGKCELSIAHFWSVRGAEEALFLPNATRDSTMTMAELMTLKPLPTPNMPAGAIDLENDGQLGAAAQVSGLVMGVRNSVQRDWDHWFTAPGYEITPSLDFADDLTVRIEFENEESLMDPTTGLLASPTEPTNDWDHIMRMRFLGRDRQDSRAQAILRSEPVETCYAIQDAMPSEMLQQ